jgi:hypothetical protein
MKELTIPIYTRYRQLPKLSKLEKLNNLFDVIKFAEMLEIAFKEPICNQLTANLSNDELVSVHAITNGYCHQCGETVRINKMVAEQYQSDSEVVYLPVHQACCTIRNGLSTSVLALALKIGYRLMMHIQMQTPKYKDWRPQFETEWCMYQGEFAEKLLKDHSSFPTDEPYSLNSPENLIHSLRRMYIEDRERPKYLHWNSNVLPWNQIDSWKEYKRKLKEHYDTFKVERDQDKKRAFIGAHEKRVAPSRTSRLCHICRGIVEKGGEIDHLQPKSKGGNGNIENLALAHKWCNKDRSAYPGSEQAISYLMGTWILRRIKAGVGIGTWEEQIAHRIINDEISAVERTTK